ncbi:hypothetical protein J2X12_004258 [Pseudarthrobacter oxydans]|uniref:Uncharacterized protein n=1 Tax=Pseudarthrobacter oxydans TaxID=1671 RepID=A0AAW8NI08_PSEOX|nr:hypothetical protein [Pseudarthrobacter oxydans]MDR7166204.1 hypothetical protein [Pseudarthrobacter oxydans]
MFEQWNTVTHLRPTVDWQSRVGDVVEIRSNVRVIRRGIVEEEMPDGSGLWLAADATEHRQYFDKDLGYELWV